MTHYRGQLPSYTALPLPDWPKADREAWLVAQNPGIVLCDGGAVSHLSTRTLEDLTLRYSYFLRFLANQERLLQDAPSAALVTEDKVLDYASPACRCSARLVHIAHRSLPRLLSSVLP